MRTEAPRSIKYQGLTVVFRQYAVLNYSGLGRVWRSIRGLITAIYIKIRSFRGVAPFLNMQYAAFLDHRFSRRDFC
jgi:hypothetical protein